MTPERELASLRSLPVDFGMELEAMKCPTCGENTSGEPRIFQTFLTNRDGIPRQPAPSDNPDDSAEVLDAGNDVTVHLTWMRCANETCSEVVVWVNETRISGEGPFPMNRNRITDTWIVRPRGGGVVPQLDPVVPEELAQDFREAHLILDASPRMSAVLARVVLDALLFAHGYTKERLTAKVDDF